MGTDSVFQYQSSDDPGAVGAGRYWLDTTDSAAPLIKRRNDANSAWITLNSPGGSAYTDEQVRDVVASFLIAGRNIYDVEHDDTGDTLSIHGKQFAGYVTTSRVFILQNQHNFGALSGQVLSVNRCYYIPVYIGDVSSPSVNAIVVNITANVTGDMQCGLFDCNQDNLLPSSRIVQSAKSSISATGSVLFTFASTPVERHRWYNIAIASVTARSVNGTNSEDDIPAIRGGMDTSFSKPGIMSFETLSVGWSSLPAIASPSTQTALWLQAGARQG